MHGRGILKYANGDQYEGEFVDGKKEGKGKWTDRENNTYEGDWVKDKKHGHGVYKTVEGFIFEGEFANNKREGKGTIITPEKTKYVCSFKDDEEVGEVEFFFANGDHALGYIKDGYLCQNGRYEFKNGDVYVGNFEKGLFHGEGYYKWNNDANYAIYEGNYSGGKKHGKGQLINKDGRILCGVFRDNNMDGEFLEISPQGNQTKGTCAVGAWCTVCICVWGRMMSFNHWTSPPLLKKSTNHIFIYFFMFTPTHTHIQFFSLPNTNIAVLYDKGFFVKVLDHIEENLNVQEFLKDSIIHTTIFSNPDMYKKLYEVSTPVRREQPPRVPSSFMMPFRRTAFS